MSSGQCHNSHSIRIYNYVKKNHMNMIQINICNENYLNIPCTWSEYEFNTNISASRKQYLYDPNENDTNIFECSKILHTLYNTAITKFNGFSVLLVPVKILRGNRKEEFSPGTFGSIALADFSALSESFSIIIGKLDIVTKSSNCRWSSITLVIYI